jgi:hypothetical protein
VTGRILSVASSVIFASGLGACGGTTKSSDRSSVPTGGGQNSKTVIEVYADRLEPAVTSLPAGRMVFFTLRSGDGRPHKVVFRGMQGAFGVPAKADLDSGVGPYKPGTYPASIDGRPTTGRLKVGAG